MNPAEASLTTRMKVGIFTVTGLLLIGAVTVFVNDKPQWWKPCQLVHINVEDATGLKAKSGVRSLGIEIGYIQSVILSETHVELGICITENVEVLPSTRAYVRSEGFLGDKFVELKPVKYVGRQPERSASDATRTQNEHGGRVPAAQAPAVTPDSQPLSPPVSKEEAKPLEAKIVSKIWNWLVPRVLDALVPSAWAQEPRQTARPARPAPDRQIPVGEQTEDVSNLVKRVDSLVGEMTTLTENLREALSPEDLRATMKQLNRTLENASRTLGPQGNLNQTAQRTLAKLEDAIEQLRDQMTRINQGEGSLGMLLNDPAYADELRDTLRNANRLLGRVNQFRFLVDVGGQEINGFDKGRGYFKLQIFPVADRYYHLGLAISPRGSQKIITTTTESGGATAVTKITSVEETALLPTFMLGKIFFRRLDLSVGALYGDGAASANLLLGPRGQEERFMIRGDLYTRSEAPVDVRLTATAKFFMGAYVMGGMESFRKINGNTNFFYGAGVAFDDEDIKMLFVLR